MSKLTYQYNGYDVCENEMCEGCNKIVKYVASTQQGIYCTNCFRKIRKELLNGIHAIENTRKAMHDESNP